MLEKTSKKLYSKNRLLPYILLVPFMLLFALPMILALLNIMVQSFGYVPSLALDTLSLEYFKRVFQDTMFWDAIIYSVKISTISSLISVALGFIIAAILSGQNKGGMIRGILEIPLLIPHFTAAFMIFLIFSQSGFFSRILGCCGIITNSGEFPHLILDSSGIGIIMAYVWKEVPFCILVILASINSIDVKLKEIAKTLGASEYQYIWNVLLPLCFPTLASTFAIIFAYNFGAFEVPFLLGASYPKTISILGYISYIDSDIKARPYNMALNVIITAMSFAIIFMYYKTLCAIKTLKVKIDEKDC